MASFVVKNTPRRKWGRRLEWLIPKKLALRKGGTLSIVGSFVGLYPVAEDCTDNIRRFLKDEGPTGKMTSFSGGINIQ